MRRRINKYKIMLLCVFLVSAALRISLSFVNQDANDYHFGVIEIIKNTGQLPTINTNWLGFHAKLYHAFVAGILRLLPSASYFTQIRIAQAVNCLAGIITII